MRRLFRSLCSVCGLALLVLAWGAPPASAVVSSSGVRPFLLGTIEFRGIPMGGWYGFPDKIAETLDLFARCARAAARCPRGDVAAILSEVAPLRKRNPHEILAAVNRLVNRIPYRSDLANFHRQEYWASPLEFLANAGDCEDYAIFKYALLRYLGLPADSLRVVLLKRKADGLGHAVLAAYLDDRVYILDNARSPVLPQSEITDYTAVFSFNENRRWAHVAGTAVAAGPSTASPPRRDAKQDSGARDGTGAGAPGGSDADLFVELYDAVYSSSRPKRDEYRVQLGAFRSLENANALWQRLWRAEWDLLGGQEPLIDSHDLAGKGRLHLLEIGATTSRRQAEALCRALSERGVDCLVVRPAAAETAAGAT